MKVPDDGSTDVDLTPPDGIRPPHADPGPADDPREREGNPDGGSKKKFDPYRFAATTLPPGLRAKLLAAELPVVPQEQLEDTVPPNRVTVTLDSEAVDHELDRTDPAVWVQRRRRRQAFVAAVVLGFLVLAIVAFLTHESSDERNAAPAPLPTATLSKPSMRPETTVVPAQAPAPATTATTEAETTTAAATGSAAARPSSATEPRIPTREPRELPRAPANSFPGSGLEASSAPDPARSAASRPVTSGNPLDRLIVAPAKE
jgi:hypothetical protein